MSHAPQPYVYDEDEVIIRTINENTQKLIEIEEQRVVAQAKLMESLEAWREFLGRSSPENIELF